MRKRNKIYLISFLVALLVIIVVIVFMLRSDNPYIHKVDTKEAFKNLDIEKLDSSKLVGAIHLSADYIINSIKENGQFVYKVNMDAGTQVNVRYNSLRHAGAVYSMCMYYELNPDQKVLEAANKAAGFIRQKLLAPIPEHPEMLGVWSLPEINNDDDPPLVKLGGNGLGLVALAYLEKLKPGSTGIPILRKMGAFILFMQKENGGFYSKYFPGPRGRDDSWTSLYYPGEAALGLMMLYEIDPDEKWLEGAAMALKYLAKLREGETKTEADHWALIATRKLMQNYRDLDLNIPAELLINHGIQICKSMILQMSQFPKHSPYYGCMTSDGRLTPTATRMEGLLSFVSLVPENRKSLIYSILMVSNKGIGFLERAQVKQGPYKGGMTREYYKPGLDPQKYRVDTDERRNAEIRIDYVQHALSAWIDYYHLVY
ncbi:MAG: hypothetical protein U5Q03_18825 [Bacteroidota bacterium]|nr:hypothetical protein [Bacteroidota bacterium]